jgi:hypothetical protein
MVERSCDLGVRNAELYIGPNRLKSHARGRTYSTNTEAFQSSTQFEVAEPFFVEESVTRRYP